MTDIKLGRNHAIALIHAADGIGCVLADEEADIAELQAAGYVDADGALSESGYVALCAIRQHKLAGGLYGEFVWPRRAQPDLPFESGETDANV